MAKEPKSSKRKLSPARMKKLQKACLMVRDVLNPALAVAGDDELPPESLSTEECTALHDTIEALQQVYFGGGCTSA